MSSPDNTCEICYEQDVERVLPCKHSLCSKCFMRVNKCPYCRRQNINMKSVLAELIKDYDGMYDKEYDVDLREDYTFANYIFNEFRNHVMREGLIKLPKTCTPHLDLYGRVEVDGGWYFPIYTFKSR